MKILAALRDDATNYYRVQCPWLVLRHQGVEVDIKHPGMRDVDAYDVLWFQMHADPASDIVIREFKDADKVVVYDVDDWLFDMPPSWYGYGEYFHHGSGLPNERLILHERAIKAADLITCTTPYLASKLAVRFPLKRIHVLPNCVLMGDWDTLPPTKHNQDGPVLGWFGTMNHWDDWMEIAEAVDEALAEVDGYLALMGAPEMLPCFPERLRKRTLVEPLIPMMQFDRVRRQIMACDVGLAWATDRLETSKCRSPLKALQYGAAGVPIVASETVYGDVLKETYFTAVDCLDNLKNWIVHLLEMAEFPRTSLAERWREQVWREHSYELQSWRWRSALETIRR